MRKVFDLRLLKNVSYDNQIKTAGYFYVRVRAFNPDKSDLYSNATLIFEILDQNDHSPVFSAKKYNFRVPEDFLIDEKIGQVIATDEGWCLNS